jgi:hypothetical protein
MGDERRREILFAAAISFLGNLLFPRLAYRMRWPSRLGPRGVAAWIAFNVVFAGFAKGWLIPRLMRRNEEFQRLLDELGREPTSAEIEAHLRKRGAGEMDG